MAVNVGLFTAREVQSTFITIRGEWHISLGTCILYRLENICRIRGVLLLLTLPSSTVLVGVLKSWFNVRQTLSTEKYPILQLLVSAPIQHLLFVLTDITILGSCSHKNTPCFRINLTVRHELQSVPLFPLCSNLLHLPVTNHLQSFIYKCIDGSCSPIQFFYL